MYDKKHYRIVRPRKKGQVWRMWSIEDGRLIDWQGESDVEARAEHTRLMREGNQDPATVFEESMGQGLARVRGFFTLAIDPPI